MNSDYNNNKNEPETWEKIKELLSEIPFFIRFIIIINILLFILNLFTNYISFYLSNIPLYTISHYQYWRLLTTSFITTNIINMILGFIFWIKDAISLEKSIGTLRYIFIFISNSIFINLIHCSIIYIIKYITKNNTILVYNFFGMYKVNNNGLLPIIICEITLLCLNNSDLTITFLYRPCPIKAKYYPFFLIIIFTLINNFRINYGIISGFIYAFIYYYIIQSRFYFSDETIKKIEKSFFCKCLVGFGGFVNVENINHFGSNSGNINIISSLAHIPSGVSPFQGNEVQAVKNNDYIAVNEQSPSNALEDINSQNKN